jgi:hypothetical protein
MKKIFIIYFVVFCLALIPVSRAVNAGTVPTFSIEGVTEGAKVTIKTYNYPANKEFVARMGLLGTKGIDGIVVGAVDSGEGGSLLFTFDIPEELQSEEAIAIRLDSTTGGYYSYNWFYNNDFGSHEGGTPAGEAPEDTDSEDTDDEDSDAEQDTAYTGIPTISITSVETDDEVTVQTHNFPADKEFVVLMGKMGTRGVNGIEVTRFDSEDGGSFSKTFDIPEELQGDYQIAIRLQTPDGIFYAFNWFYNNTEKPEVYTGIPTFTITEVVEDESVTILTNNFPADYDFDVLMGKMFTRGINGILVTSVNSSEGGELTGTFSIPEELFGEYRIAIRLESTEDGYYAYNWFYNNTYPEP